MEVKIDHAVLQAYTNQYKESFAQHRFSAEYEIYKWKAVKCFQDHWDIDAPNFSAMLKLSLAKTANLLSSAQSFPKKMMEWFAENEPEAVRQMFRGLYDESVDVVKRAKKFESEAARLWEAHPLLRMPYQDPHAISTYLWLRYPDKYYIYTYSVLKDNARKLCGLEIPTGKYDRMVFSFALCHAIRQGLAQDSALIMLSQNSLTDDCYPDMSLNTLTIDISHFISKHEIAPDSAYTFNVPLNTILYGPPGTGKTYASVQYAVAIVEEKSLYRVQREDYPSVYRRYQQYLQAGLIALTVFHQSYGYEEFIEGIRPVVMADGEKAGDIAYAVRDGVFKAFCHQAAADESAKNRVFMIDEINRGNITKIFGELITLLEPSKRIGAEEARQSVLPYSGQLFGVPRHVYIIGTMNTADRSIALMDTALRRRFTFIEMQADSGLLRDVVVEGIDVAEMLDTLNQRITVLLDREHTLGHAYFLELKEDASLTRLADIFEHKVLPLLQEYFYDDYDKIRLVLGDNQKKDDGLRFIVKKSDPIQLFGHADIEYPDYYEINREAFKRIEAYAYFK